MSPRARSRTPRSLGRRLLARAQDEDADAHEWNKAAAGAACLGYVAAALAKLVDVERRWELAPAPGQPPDDFAALARPALEFVQANLTSADWRRKEAALVAFGQVLEGGDALEPYVAQALPLLMQALVDQVRDDGARARRRSARARALPPLLRTRSRWTRARALSSRRPRRAPSRATCS